MTDRNDEVLARLAAVESMMASLVAELALRDPNGIVAQFIAIADAKPKNDLKEDSALMQDHFDRLLQLAHSYLRQAKLARERASP